MFKPIDETLGSRGRFEMEMSEGFGCEHREEGGCDLVDDFVVGGGPRITKVESFRLHGARELELAR